MTDPLFIVGASSITLLYIAIVWAIVIRQRAYVDQQFVSIRHQMNKELLAFEAHFYATHQNSLNKEPLNVNKLFSKPTNITDITAQLRASNRKTPPRKRNGKFCKAGEHEPA